MADDYIKRKDAEMSHCSECSWNGCSLCPCEDVKAILAIPAADVVEVVRCKDCKHYKTAYCAMDIWHKDITIYTAKPDDYCSRGVRKDG